MKLFTIIMMLHVCAAVDWALTYRMFFSKHTKLAKIFEKLGLLWTIQSVINLLIMIIVALATFNDEEELRAALYRLTLSERGNDESFDQKIDGIVAFKEASRTPGEPAWVSKVCFGGMGVTVAIWLLAIIH